MAGGYEKWGRYGIGQGSLGAVAAERGKPKPIAGSDRYAGIWSAESRKVGV